MRWKNNYAIWAVAALAILSLVVLFTMRAQTEELRIGYAELNRDAYVDGFAGGVAYCDGYPGIAWDKGVYCYDVSTGSFAFASYSDYGLSTESGLSFVKDGNIAYVLAYEFNDGDSNLYIYGSDGSSYRFEDFGGVVGDIQSVSYNPSQKEFAVAYKVGEAVLVRSYNLVTHEPAAWTVVDFSNARVFFGVPDENGVPFVLSYSSGVTGVAGVYYMDYVGDVISGVMSIEGVSSASAFAVVYRDGVAYVAGANPEGFVSFYRGNYDMGNEYYAGVDIWELLYDYNADVANASSYDYAVHVVPFEFNGESYFLVTRYMDTDLGQYVYAVVLDLNARVVDQNLFKIGQGNSLGEDVQFFGTLGEHAVSAYDLYFGSASETSFPRGVSMVFAGAFPSESQPPQDSNTNAGGTGGTGGTTGGESTAVTPPSAGQQPVAQQPRGLSAVPLPSSLSWWVALAMFFVYLVMALLNSSS